jgi:ubiquinone/menaquinone biosynthesis C-methylase UbiE
MLLSDNIFDSCAQEYDNWFEINKYAYLSELKALKKIVPKKARALEIGVGSARFAGPLGIRIGVDPSMNMLRIARARGIRTVLGNGENLPFKSKSFALVLLMVTLCYVDYPERVMSEARRVLDNRGRIVVGIIDKESELGEIYQSRKEGSKFYHDANFYSATEVLALLKGHNFKNIGIVQTIFHLPGEMRSVDPVRDGFGQGGFVVARGEKLTGYG